MNDADKKTITDKLVDDINLAVKVMRDTGEFETGQGILVECVNTIKALTAERDALQARVAELEGIIQSIDYASNH